MSTPRIVTPEPREDAVSKKIRGDKLRKLADVCQKKLKVAPLAFEDSAKPREFLSTGFRELDDAISGSRHPKDQTRLVSGSGKGMPRGRIVEIFGPEASAKTSLALAVAAETIRRGLEVVYIDCEHALSFDFAAQVLGVKLQDMSYYDPDNGDDALDVLKEAVKLRVPLVVLDSVSALVPKMELEGKQGLAPQARMMSSVCRSITSYLGRDDDSCVIFINQLRYKVGVVFGNPEMTTGGNALKYYSSVRIEVRKQADLKVKSGVKGQPAVVGQRMRLKVLKNKVAPPFGQVHFDLLYNKGIRMIRAAKDSP